MSANKDKVDSAQSSSAALRSTSVGPPGLQAGSVLSVVFTLEQIRTIANNLVAAQVPSPIVLRLQTLLGIPPNLRSNYLALHIPTQDAIPGNTNLSGAPALAPVSGVTQIITKLLSDIYAALKASHNSLLISEFIALFHSSNSSNRLLQTAPSKSNTSKKRPAPSSLPDPGQTKAKKRKKIPKDDKEWYCSLCKRKFATFEADIRFHLKCDHLIPLARTRKGKEYYPFHTSFGPFDKNKYKDKGTAQRELKAAGRYHHVPKKLRERWKKILDTSGEGAAEAYAERKKTWENLKYFGNGKVKVGDEGDITEDEAAADTKDGSISQAGVNNEDGDENEDELEETETIIEGNNSAIKQEVDNEASLFFSDDDLNASPILPARDSPEVIDSGSDEFGIPIAPLFTREAAQRASASRQRLLAGTQNSVGNEYISEETRVTRRNQVEAFLQQSTTANRVVAVRYLTDSGWDLRAAVQEFRREQQLIGETEFDQVIRRGPFEQ